MADVEKININSTDYDIADAKALRDKNVNASSFIDTRAGTTTYPTDNVNLNECLIIGKGAYNTNPTGANWNVVVGNAARSGSGSFQTIIGSKAVCGDQNNMVAIGYNANASAQNSIAIGVNSQAYGRYNVTIGHGTTSATSGFSTVIGSSSQASGSNSVAIGYGAADSSNDSVAIGQGVSLVSNSAKSVAIGQGARVAANSPYSTVIGAGAKNNHYNSYSIAIGYNAEVKQPYAAQIGTGTNVKYGSLQFRDWQLVDQNGKIPEDRLPTSSVFATANPPRLSVVNEPNVSEIAILYTGETCSAMTNSLCYKAEIQTSRPYFDANWANTDYLKSEADILIDQEKLFLKFAEISQERIGDGDTWNSIVGGDNTTQDLYFYYDSSNEEWRIEFSNSSFESLDNSTPDPIENITTAQLESDFGIRINTKNFTPEEDSDNEIFDVSYEAPIHCSSIDSNASEYVTVDYMKFMTEMCDGDWGFFHVVPNLDFWEYTVDGTTHAMPIIPATYSYDGDEYSDVTMRWEWEQNLEEWHLYINGADCGFTWTTTSMYNQFGITIESGEEDNIEHIELVFAATQQRGWKQFDPVNTNNIATQSNISTLTTAVNSKVGYTVEKVTGDISTWANNKLTTGIYIVQTRATKDSVFNASVGTLIVFDNETNTTNFHSITQVFIGGTLTYAVNVPLPANTIWMRSVNYNKNTQQWEFNTWRPMLNEGNAELFDGYDANTPQVLTHDINGRIYWAAK